MKHLSKYLPIKTLILMYKSLIRPHFDYCDVIFHIPPLNNRAFGNGNNVNVINNIGTLHVLMTKIESVQYQAALAITGTWQGTSRVKLYKEIGLESLSDRRSCSRVLQLFKIKNNLTPEYLRRKLPPLNLDDVNPNLFREIRTRTLRYKSTFFPNAINSWNNIIGHIQGNTTLNSIKTHILKIIRPIPKSFYDIHDPIGLHYLFQLRTELSPLRSHKFRHNFSDTPTDICSCNEGSEDNKHFLFECLLYAIHRAPLAVNITNILLRNNLIELADDVDFYLYGHPRLALIDNKKVLSSTIRYLKVTQRFSR